MVPGEGAGNPAKGIADARTILNGTVRPRGGSLRVVTQLTDAATGTVRQQWVEDVLTPALAAEHAGARTVAFFQKPAMHSAAHPKEARSAGESSHREAVSYYDRGKEFFFRYNLADQLRAIESFRRAVELDPDYAAAQAMLAWACQLRAVTHPTEPWLDESEKAATAALRLAPHLPEAHRARGGILQRRGQMRASLDSYLAAYELNPSDGRAAATLGSVYEHLGRPDLALQWLEKAATKETRPVYADNIGNALTMLGRYNEAEKAYRTAAIFRPDLPVGQLGLARLASLQGDNDKARSLSTQALADYSRDPQPIMMAALVEFFDRRFASAKNYFAQAQMANPGGGVEFSGAVRFTSALAYIELEEGDPLRGRALLAEAKAADEKEIALAPDHSNRHYSLAATLAIGGESEAALDALQRAVQQGWIDYRSTKMDPRFDSLRDAPRYAELIGAMENQVKSLRSRASAQLIQQSEQTNER